MMSRAAAACVALAAAGCGGTQSMLNPVGPQARSIAGLTWWFFGVCAVVYVAVMGALFWAVARRGRPADTRPDVDRRLGRVVAGALGLTVLTLVGLTLASVSAGRSLEPPSAKAAVTVDVIGHQWWWDFQYNNEDRPIENVDSPNELHLPAGVPVTIRAKSADVIHSFWVPNLRGKRDLIPPNVTYLWIQADRPGVYRGQCAEFCGHQHAHMAFPVVVESMDDFQRWLHAQRQAARPPATDTEKRGQDVFMSGPCVLCHTIRGTSAGSGNGPDLTHVSSRRTLAAGTLPNTPDHLADWIADPQAIKPGSLMPPNVMGREDLQALVAYLGALK